MTRKAMSACRASLLVAIAASLLVPGSADLVAQQTAPPPAPVGDQNQAPPVIRFAAQGISLEEAVRLALEHDPFIQRSEADAAFSAGVAQQQSGLFDLLVTGSVAWSRRVQELTESRKEEEQKKRDDLQQVVDRGPGDIANAQQARDLLVGIQNGTATAADLAAVSPTLSATLQSLDQLIATSTPPLTAELVGIRNQVLNQAVQTAETQLQTAQRILADTQQGLTDLGPAPDDEFFRDLTFNLQLNKVLRSGITISPFFDSEYSSTGFVGKPHEAQFGGKGLTDLYTFRAGVGAMVPLGRGRGAAAVAAPERAALFERDASLLVLEHERATTVLQTIRSYWQLRAAQDTLAIAEQSLQFQNQLVAAIQQLVSGGDLAGVELSRAQAAQARARADRDEAERRFSDARVGLAIAMGVAATADDATLPRAQQAFPELQQSPTTTPALLSQAMAQRQDLEAASQLEEAGRVLAEGARLNTKSRLDLTVASWFTALDEGTASKALDRWVGPSGSVELQFEKPMGNNALLGQLAQREADARRRQIDQRDLARQIGLNVIQSASTLQASITRVQQAQAAVDLYQVTIDAEFGRLQAGDSTVIDTVITQQQQTGALLALVSAQLELASRIAELRFQTGTLLTGAGLRAGDLITVPGSGGR